MKPFNLIVIGFLAGFASASLGIGGGAILVPTLFLFLKYDIKKVIGTSLAVAFPVAFLGTFIHYLMSPGSVKFFAAFFTVIGSIAGVGLGVRLVNITKGAVLARLFALLLFIIGLKLAGIINFYFGPVSENALYPFLTLTGLLAGVTGAMFGMGGGVIMVPAFYLFFGLSMHEAVSTSLLVIAPTTLVGAAFHNKFKNMLPETLKYLLPAALLGAIAGALISKNLNGETLRLIFSILILASALKMFFGRAAQ